MDTKATVNRRACKACNAPLIFAPTPEGKSVPLDGRAPIYHLAVGVATRAREHYVSHFATCPDANRFGGRKVAARPPAVKGDNSDVRLEALMDCACAMCECCRGLQSHRSIPTQRVEGRTFAHRSVVDGAADRLCSSAPIWAILQAEGLLEVSP